MEKEEILSRARQEGILRVDEGSKHMRSRGQVIGRLLFSFVFLVIALLSLITGNPIDAGVRAMFLDYVTGEAYMEWSITKNKFLLLFSLGAGVYGAVSLVEAVCHLYGVAL